MDKKRGWLYRMGRCFYGINRRAWLKANKKEPRRKGTLMTLFAVWMVPGFIIGAAVDAGMNIQTQVSGAWIGLLALALFGILLGGGMIWVAYNYTKNNFDLDGIYQTALGKWRKQKAAYLEERGDYGQEKGKTQEESGEEERTVGGSGESGSKTGG
jgi:hypothetical protein